MVDSTRRGILIAGGGLIMGKIVTDTANIDGPDVNTPDIDLDEPPEFTYVEDKPVNPGDVIVSNASLDSYLYSGDDYDAKGHISIKNTSDMKYKFRSYTKAFTDNGVQVGRELEYYGSVEPHHTKSVPVKWDSRTSIEKNIKKLEVYIRFFHNHGGTKHTSAVYEFEVNQDD